MNSTYIQSLNSTFKPMIDPVTFLGAGAATAAISGVSLISPLGLGILLASGINGLSSAAVSQLFDASVKDAPFFRMCAATAAVGLTTFGAYMGAPLLAPASAIMLTQQMALAVGCASIVTKTATVATQEFRAKSATMNLPPSKAPVGPRHRPKKPQPTANTKGPRTRRLRQPQQPLAERRVETTTTLGPLNWKKVGVVAFFALAMLAPIACRLASTFLINEPILPDPAPLPLALLPALLAPRPAPTPMMPPMSLLLPYPTQHTQVAEGVTPTLTTDLLEGAAFYGKFFTTIFLGYIVAHSIFCTKSTDRIIRPELWLPNGIFAIYDRETGEWFPKVGSIKSDGGDPIGLYSREDGNESAQPPTGIELVPFQDPVTGQHCLVPPPIGSNTTNGTEEAS